MATSHIAEFVTVLALSVIIGSLANPGHVHTKHVIHAPLHIKMIHHHKIVKVPIVFRKHLHHHKHLSHEEVYIPLKQKPKPVYEDDDSGDDSHHSVSGHKVIHYQGHGGDSGETSGGSAGDYGGGYKEYYSQIGGKEEHSSGPDRSEDDNSYEYEESQEQPSYSSYSFRGPH